MSILKKVARRLGLHDAIYDEDYYENDVSGPANQAAPFIAQSLSALKIKSLTDVGCGTGAMMEPARSLGISVRGLEYSTAGLRLCKQRGLDVMKFDIERDDPPKIARSDAALSLEVAEHIPESASERYVSLLCELAPRVVCSAAKPGQDGTDHVNLQPRSYWIKKFDSRNFIFDAVSTEHVADFWRRNGVAGFYWENLMIFRN